MKYSIITYSDALKMYNNGKNIAYLTWSPEVMLNLTEYKISTAHKN